MTFDWLDIITTILGLIYIWLEYRAHIALWIVGIIMPALDAVLYWNHGLYGDAGMACYYTLAAFYGLFFWKFKKTRKKKECCNTFHHIILPPYSLIPELAIVSTMLLCEKMKHTTGRTIMKRVDAEDTPVRATPPAANVRSAKGRVFNSSE